MEVDIALVNLGNCLKTLDMVLSDIEHHGTLPHNLGLILKYSLEDANSAFSWLCAEIEESKEWMEPNYDN